MALCIPFFAALPLGAGPEKFDWASLRQLMHRVVVSQIRCTPREADDLASEAVVDLLRATRRGSVQNIEGLAVTIARAKAIGHLRKCALQHRIMRHLDDLDLQVADVRTMPVDRMLAFQEVLFEIRQRLSDPERQLLEWRLQEKTWQELAEKTHETAAAIRQRWHRTTERIRDILQAMGFET